MGWANCGTDSKGRPIGYAHSGTCDHPGCEAKIERGVSAACGKMHGTGDVRTGDPNIEWGDYNCEQYFCHKHLVMPCLEHEDGAETYGPILCRQCADRLEKDYREDEDWRQHWPTSAPPLQVRGMCDA